MTTHVVVVGAGLTGLVSAIRLREAGAEVSLVTKGIGGFQLGQGTIDVLGYAPQPVTGPVLDALPEFVGHNPYHPYAILGADAVRVGVDYLRTLIPDLIAGDLGHNYFLPTPVGALRPTALPQPSMVAGECVDGKKMLFVGLRQLKDFWPELIAGNLARTELPDGGRLEARHAWIDLPAREGEVDSSPLTYARAMDDPEFRRRFIAELKRVIEPGETIGLPGVLGLEDRGAWRDVQDQVGQPVFEISTIPPSVPGMRLNDDLTRIAKDARVNFVLGSPVSGAVTDGKRITAVCTETAGRTTEVACDHVIFVPGGFESGAISVDSFLRVSEPALGLPVWKPDGPLVVEDPFAAQPLFGAGVRVDEQMRVLDADDEPVYENLHAAGGILAGAFRWMEKSGEGIALASAVRAVDSILGVTNGRDA